MGRTTEFTAGTMRIEYVKARRALRLTAVGGAGEPVEVPLAALVDRLQIERSDLGVQPRLLLFTGLHDQPRYGSGDLAGWFAGEEEARAAFREARAVTHDGEGWAELVALEGGRRPAVRAWFGRADEKRHLRVVAGRGHHPAAGGPHLRLLAR